MSDQYLICTACGTQHPHTSRSTLKTCFICDDPRQFVPPSGQSFTTLSELRSSTSPKYKNEFHPYQYSSPEAKFKAARSGSDSDSNPEPTIEDLQKAELISITTTPKFGIGQRAILVRLPSGKNLLWDCVAYLDDDTIHKIKQLGGVDAMVISHPHFYTTHLEWAEALGNVPVYLAADDKKWRARLDEGVQREVTETETVIRDKEGRDLGVRAVKLGGHFPGSMVLHIPHSGRLLTADTIFTTPSGLSNWEVNALGEPRSRPEDTNSYSFMWSIPNMIPLSAEEIARMWGVLKKYEFKSTHGLILGQDIEDVDVKKRVLESVKIQLRMMGVREHEIFDEEI
ncbi:beta-lactamase-like protein [Sordaria brevicollis]|uniref:Beta-lactamase-like protein n=1 Tax=Sordaria brevicollis TaxID=83679 RepID=A0AAE0U2U4_SORBR|nr:beta-lactamase-like protein [Sordaria brevicollis]